MRKRHGQRRHKATAWQHDGSQDDAGQPTYSNDTDWSPVVTNWPVELVAVRGGETLRGRQVAAETTHVVFGEYFGGNGILPEHRCVIDGVTFGVVSAMDIDGLSTELRVELKREVN